MYLSSPILETNSSKRIQKESEKEVLDEERSREREKRMEFGDFINFIFVLRIF